MYYLCIYVQVDRLQLVHVNNEISLQAAQIFVNLKCVCFSGFPFQDEEIEIADPVVAKVVVDLLEPFVLFPPQLREARVEFLEQFRKDGDEKCAAWCRALLEHPKIRLWSTRIKFRVGDWVALFHDMVTS